MKHYIPAFAALAVSFMSSPLAPALKADQSNKKTEITIDQPVAVEGKVLSPGSYVMKVLDATEPSSRSSMPKRTTSSTPSSPYPPTG
jgi:hypothetical protein